MSSKLSKTILAVAVALTLGAWATPGLTAQSGADRFAKIHPGLTQAEVVSLLGTPGSVIHNTFENAIIWVYPLSTDVYGSEFDVEFKDGVVTESFTLQHQSGS